MDAASERGNGPPEGDFSGRRSVTWWYMKDGAGLWPQRPRRDDPSTLAPLHGRVP